jgi:hypothetical protein
MRVTSSRESHFFSFRLAVDLVGVVDAAVLLMELVDENSLEKELVDVALGVDGGLDVLVDVGSAKNAKSLAQSCASANVCSVDMFPKNPEVGEDGEDI